MIFTLTDRNYNALDAYETDDYLIGQYIGSILETLEMEVSVKSLNAQHWIQGHYIMCTDKTGRNYWFTIYDVDDSLSSDYKKISCFSGTIDIVSEEFPPIKATSPQPFTWYLNQIFVDTGIVIGINEIADMKRTLEFEGTNHTNVEMLQFVLNGFDNADARLEVEFDGVRPVKIALNVYKHLGAIEPQELLTSEVDNLEELERKGSISELATGLRPTGEETDGKALTLKGKYYEEKDVDGNILYYSPKDMIEIFSVQGHQNFFVDLPNKANGEFDGYIVRDYSSQAKTQDALWREALIKLKKIDHASIEYEAKGYITCDLGDNVQIVAHEMKPPVMISARVTEYKFNDDDSSRNEYKFNNFVELESNMSELDKIIADIKKDIDYVVDMKVDYAIGNDNVTVPVTWVEKEPSVPQGKYLWTRTSTYMSKGAVIPAYSITYVAIDGKPGENGLDTYVHKSWSWSADGTDRFTDKYPNENTYTKETNFFDITPGMIMLKKEANGFRCTGGSTSKDSFKIPLNIQDGKVSVSFKMKGNQNVSVQLKVKIGNKIDTFKTSSNNTFNYFHLTSEVDSSTNYVQFLDVQWANFFIEDYKTEKGLPTIYTPSPKDDYENAYPKYEGYYSSHSPVQSTNPSDYAWSVIRGENGKDGTDGKNGTDGKDGITPKDVISGYLSNESIIVPATPTGTVTDLSKAFGDFVVFEGQTKKTSGVTYTKVSEVGMTSTINSNGRYVISALSADTGTATYRATYSGVTIDKIMIVVKNKQGQSGADGKDGQQGIQGVPGKDGSNGKDGATGPQGPPTGITTSVSVPTNPYVNMLWQNTGNTPGYITGVTYQWNGVKWNIYIFTAENIAVTSLSAISSNIGMITAGVINGAVIISEFQRDLWEGSGIYKKGKIQVTDGQMITTFDEIQRSTNTILAKGLIISDENGFSISRVTPTGQLLNGTTYATDYIGMSDVANGFVGKITAASLTETPWITLPLRTGYSIAEDNPPQYRIIYNLDGTKEIVFRGQFKKNSGTMNAGSEQWFIQIPENIYPTTTIMKYGAADNGNGCRLSMTTFGRFAAIIGVTASNYVEISSMTYQIK